MLGQYTVMLMNILFVQLFDRTTDLLMKLLLSLGQDRVIDNLTGQGMFKDIGRLRIYPSLIQKL